MQSNRHCSTAFCDILSIEINGANEEGQASVYTASLALKPLGDYTNSSVSDDVMRRRHPRSVRWMPWRLPTSER